MYVLLHCMHFYKPPQTLYEMKQDIIKKQNDKSSCSGKGRKKGRLSTRSPLEDKEDPGAGGLTEQGPRENTGRMRARAGCLEGPQRLGWREGLRVGGGAVGRWGVCS